MKKLLQSHIVSTGLAIFSMLFGAGNLMYPLQVGMESGNKTWIGITGFILTAICLPVAGFVAMMLFNGNYKAFYARLGKTLGSIMVGVCMLIIGPIIAIPRITTLSHTMTAPFLPIEFLRTVTPMSSFIFSLAFLGITFLLTYKENNIVDILGKIISPLLLVSLIIIITKGILFPDAVATISVPGWELLKTNLTRGYETLDLLGALFFSSIILVILKNTLGSQTQHNPKTLAMIGLKAGMLGTSLLALVYVGMSALGMYHGHAFAHVNPGELFSAISFKVLGSHGAAIIATAVLMACLSTSIALSAVVAEYVHGEIFNKSIGYINALVLVLLSCIPLSTAGLGSVLKLTSGIITYVGYPVLIALTFCNIAYKLFDFQWVKLPVFVTFVLSFLSYYNFI